LNHELVLPLFFKSEEPLAIVFELSAECSGTNDCAALVKHFHGLQMTLLTGRTISWKASEVDHSTAMSAHSPDLSMYGVRTLQDALELTESGIRLYHHLKNGPAFRFARVALEAGLVELAELRHWVAPMADGECRFEIECAVDESLCREMGSPQFCYPFRDGYWWTRYRGEQYLPVYSRDQNELNALCRSLFPEYFQY
jgi:hypothetical protein